MGIELKGIFKAFGTNQVLRGVDLTVETGSTVVIMIAFSRTEFLLSRDSRAFMSLRRANLVLESETRARFGWRPVILLLWP